MANSTFLGPFASYRSAPAPSAAPSLIEPTTPTSYARLAWYVAALVFWLLLGMLVQRYGPLVTKPPVTTEAFCRPGATGPVWDL